MYMLHNDTLFLSLERLVAFESGALRMLHVTLLLLLLPLQWRTSASGFSFDVFAVVVVAAAAAGGGGGSGGASVATITSIFIKSSSLLGHAEASGIASVSAMSFMRPCHHLTASYALAFLAHTTTCPAH